MPLFCQGHMIITDGELVALARLVDFSSPTLTAMAVGGEDVDPNEALRTLDLDLRFASLGDEEVRRIIDRGIQRLTAAFPSLFGG